jgi:hypothetical protein
VIVNLKGGVLATRIDAILVAHEGPDQFYLSRVEEPLPREAFQTEEEYASRN